MKSHNTIWAILLIVVTTLSLLFGVNAQQYLNNDDGELSFWFSDITVDIFESFPEQYSISATVERNDASLDLELGVCLFIWKTDVLENSLPSLVYFYRSKAVTFLANEKSTEVTFVRFSLSLAVIPSFAPSPEELAFGVYGYADNGQEFPEESYDTLIPSVTVPAGVYLITKNENNFSGSMLEKWTFNLF